LLGVYLLWGFAQAALALWVIRPFVTEAYVRPTASMSPTLAPGDCILANKLQRPRRWDIVLYHPPLPDGTVGGDTYCKRLVGLPGERLRVEGGNLYVNDRLVAAPPMVAGRYTMGRYGLHYHDGQTITLAADQLFLIGDSVNKSYDSRFAAAALPEDATCLHHPRKKAVAVCAGTGDYVCSLCAIELNGQTYSAEYLNGPGKNLAGKAFDRMLPRPDSQILFYMLLCFVPYLNVIFIAFAFVWIPHAIYLYVKLLRLRRQNEVLARVVGQGRLITVAILIGLFAVGWIIGAIAIAAVVVRKYG
jgi:signal peptidase I